MADSERRKRLEADAKHLRTKLTELDAEKPDESRRPMHEVARKHISDRLTQIGHELRRLGD